MRTRLAALALAVAAAGLAPSSARADFVGKVVSVSTAVGYGVTVTGAIATAAVNGVAIAYDEATMPGWRAAGVIVGGVDLILGAGLLIHDPNGLTNQLYATGPILAGTAAVMTAVFASPGEPGRFALAPMFVPGQGAGISWCGRF